MRFFLGCVLALAALAQQPFFDRTHASRVFGQERNYRILLPPSYESSGKRYPVIYYFHGHSDRYTLEHYDQGKDTIPKIAAFVAANDVIVVSVDGFVAADYKGFYGGAPWDLYEPGGKMDFGQYFLELVEQIDGKYRTLTDRRHRATSGLSMGGFMSLYLSARYPHLIGSASSFNPGPEFFTGDPGRRVLWRPKDHVSSHTGTMIRLIRASGDYISQYHEETRAAYASAHDVDFEYRQDEYHKHWATSIGETFEFHKRAFANSALDNVPVRWSHANAYRTFDVWGWHVETEGGEPGYTYLTDVTQQGLRITTRRWAPDGPAVTSRKIQLTTAPLYQAGSKYRLLDHNMTTGQTSVSDVVADATGRLRIQMDGAGHQISFNGPGASDHPPVLLPLTTVRVPPSEVPLPLRIYNPRSEPMRDVKVVLTSRYPTVHLLKHTVTVPQIGAGASAEVPMSANFTAGTDYFARARLNLTMTYDGWHTASENIDVQIVPEAIPHPQGIEVLDGRTFTFSVFRQKGNQGGGGSVQRAVTEGKGNGNGILEPGEEATIWVKLRQGMDPFDKNNWYRTKVYSDSKWVTEIADLAEQKQLEWTGAKERTSVVRLAADAPPGTTIPLLLDNESWSYHYTPDVRYGPEPLYQAFQLHTRHLHKLDLRVPDRPVAYSPTVLRAGQPDPTSLKRFAAAIVAGAKTPREKAEAIWRFFLTDGRFVKPGFWYHIAGWAYEEPLGEVLDPMKLLNSYGFGLCYHIAPLLEAVYEAAVFEDARVWFLTGHTVAEVFYDGSYHYFDSDMMGYTRTDEGRVASVEDLERKPELLLKPGTVSDPWYPADVRANAMGSLAELFSTKENNWVFPFKRYSEGHTMDFTLRPGESMTRFFEPQGYYLPYRFDGRAWSEFPREIARYNIRTEDGPRSQKDSRSWGTGVLTHYGVDREVVSPYVIIDATFTADVDVPAGKTVVVETSTDRGKTWTAGGEKRGPYKGQWAAGPAVVASSEHGKHTTISGTYGYRVRYRGDDVLNARIDTRFQLNPRTLPALQPGANEIRYRAGPQLIRSHVLDPARVQNAAPMREAGQEYTLPTRGETGEVVFELPANIGFDVGGRFLDLSDGIAPDKLTAETRRVQPFADTVTEGSIAWSTSPKGPWQMLWQYEPPKSMDRTLRWPEVDRSVRDISADKVYIRYLFRGLAVDGFRVAAYQRGDAPAGSLRITHIWREDSTERKHVETIHRTSEPHTYTIHAGPNIKNVALIFEACGAGLQSCGSSL